ncbi:MAG: PEGA domain-containing protein [Pirellulales bacterium]|nr:PEGA domain-containing protein [Pirellulales bacterium]
MTISSNPPGAIVKVDDVEVGRTPVSTSFIYYGTRKIQLSKAGYETLTVLQPIPTPWYQWPGVDFFSEHFSPGKINDDRLFSYNMEPAIVVPTDQLLDRAQELRQQSEVLEATELPVESLPVPGNTLPSPLPPPPPVDNRLPL